MDAYELHEARFIQESAGTSAANALAYGSAACPDGKIRTVLSAGYRPSTAETQTCYFYIVSKSASEYPISIPQAIALSASLPLPLLTEGMEIKLYPGEILAIARSAATAGSTMNLKIRFIETDLPYYAYKDPLGRVVQTQQKHGSIFRSSGGLSQGGGPGPVDRGDKGGGGEPQPI